MIRTWARHPLTAAIAASVTLRLAIFLSLRLVGVDEAIMHGHGSSLWRSGTYLGIQWPITYPVVTSLLGFVIGPRPAVGLVYVLGGPLMLVPLYFAMRRLRDERAARWGTLLVALLPAVGVVIAKSGSHSIFLPLLAAAFYLHVRALDRCTTKGLALLGLVLGAAYVTRSDGIVYLGAVAGSWLLHGPAWGERVRRAVIVVAAALVFVVPNVLHVRHHTGRASLSAHVGTMLQNPFYISGLSDDELADLTEEFRQTEGGLLTQLRDNPGYVVRKLAYNVRLFLKNLGDIYVFPAILFVLLGLAVPSFFGGWHRGAGLLLLWTAPSLAFLPLNIEARYACPLAMFCALFAGEGWRALEDLADRPRLRLGLWGAGAALIVFLLSLTVMQVAVARSIEDLSLPVKARVVVDELGDELPDSFILNPELRIIVDGTRGVPRSAPHGTIDQARVFVIDTGPLVESERARLTRVTQETGRAFRLRATADGLEFHEVVAER